MAGGTSAAPIVIGSVTENGSLSVGSGSTAGFLQLSNNGGTSQLSSLNIGSGSTLDVTNNTVTIKYGSGTDPLGAIVSCLASGYHGGAWNGTGIDSSAVAGLNASQRALIYALGYSDGADGITNVPSGEIEIMATMAGDAKLQGNVVFGDFQLLAEYFGQSGGWDQGNFTYGGTVDFGDFQLLAQDFGANSSALTAGELASLNGFAEQFGDRLVANANGGFSLVAVPEPASLSLLALGGVGLLGGRKRA
ncbi:MAG TPA: PEP-CTERM sorting domain-containing protein [Tepidisphaeraceae bacterium]|nr:PEP-CTERM sorting domain-containing protein [Tepidisphaeraceae bacterium]